MLHLSGGKTTVEHSFKIGVMTKQFYQHKKMKRDFSLVGNFVVTFFSATIPKAEKYAVDFSSTKKKLWGKYQNTRNCAGKCYYAELGGKMRTA